MFLNRRRNTLKANNCLSHKRWESSGITNENQYNKQAHKNWTQVHLQI